MLISYAKKETKNLGNYENISVEIKIEDEVVSTEETPEECLNRLRKFVSLNIDLELNRKVVIDSNTIKQLITHLIKIDTSNKTTIKNILSEQGVSRVGELDENNLQTFHKKLIELRGQYE